MLRNSLTMHIRRFRKALPPDFCGIKLFDITAWTEVFVFSLIFQNVTWMAACQGQKVSSLRFSHQAVERADKGGAD